MSKLGPFNFTLVCLSLALGAGLSACGAAESFPNESAGENEPPVATLEEALFYTKAGACSNYEAESIAHAGGVATSGGWKLSNAGDNINVNRTFVAGEHTITVIARGTAGGGAKPQFKLTLNGYQVGSNVTVTNTSITSGWSEYALTYKLQSAGNKLIKVELANPGNGRALLIDGVSVYCPKPGVMCGSTPNCTTCCADGVTCDPSCASGSIRCDQNSDCSGGDICALKGTAFNGYAVGCQNPQTCDTDATVVGSTCGEVCKAPWGPERACSDGRECKETTAGSYFNTPGWKYCKLPEVTCGTAGQCPAAQGCCSPGTGGDAHCFDYQSDPNACTTPASQYSLCDGPTDCADGSTCAMTRNNNTGTMVHCFEGSPQQLLAQGYPIVCGNQDQITLTCPAGTQCGDPSEGLGLRLCVSP